MNRLSSLQIAIFIALICVVVLPISVLGLLNNLEYDFVEREFWFFFITLILSISGLIVVGGTPVLFYDDHHLMIKRWSRKELIALNNIDKLYLEASRYKLRIGGINTLRGGYDYYKAQIIFNPILTRKSIFFTATTKDLEKFSLFLKNR